MRGYQSIAVVTTSAAADNLRGLGREVDRGALVLTAPTGAARSVTESVARAVHGEVRPDVLLAPVSHPEVDRGHRLDALVREHALRDRFRDVVVVADPATVTLLLRVLAPDQLASGGPVTVVGLRRADPPVSPLRVALAGGVLGTASAGLDGLLLFVLPLVAALVGLVLLALPSQRRTGREALLAAAVGALVVVMVVAGSTRFPSG